MLAISVNVLWLPLMVVVSVILGIIISKGENAKLRKRIISLENEMLSDHAQILSLQQQLSKIQKDRGSSTRVVPMKDSNAAEDPQKGVK